MGSPITFAIAILLIVAWALSGFFVGFGDSWQLAANTSTTIVTTIMVLLVQNTQNRDSQAIQLKLNEIIRATHQARNKMIALEEAEESEAQQLQQEFKQLREED